MESKKKSENTVLKKRYTYENNLHKCKVRKSQKPAYPLSPPCQKSYFNVKVYKKENTLL